MGSISATVQAREPKKWDDFNAFIGMDRPDIEFYWVNKISNRIMGYHGDKQNPDRKFVSLPYHYFNTMKGPLFYSKILLFGEYGIIKDSKGLSIPYNFFKGALKTHDNPSEAAKKSNLGLREFAGYLEMVRKNSPDLVDFDFESLKNDIAAGMYAYTGILTALLQRGRTGEGATLEVTAEGIAEVAGHALALASQGTGGIHVSFDMDVCDPAIAPGVGTPSGEVFRLRGKGIVDPRGGRTGDLLVQTCRRIGIVSTVFGSIWAFMTIMNNFVLPLLSERMASLYPYPGNILGAAAVASSVAMVSFHRLR